MVHIESGFGYRIEGCASSHYGHSFGGQHEYGGVLPKGGKGPVHLLYRFNLDDPSFPLKIDGLRWLPLFYPFQYDAGRLGYRVVGDSEIQILSLHPKKFLPNFPYPQYPRFLPKCVLRLVPITTREQRAFVFYNHLEKHVLLRRLGSEDKVLIDRIGVSFARVGQVHELVQDYPHLPCPNPKCENHRIEYGLRTFATLWNEPIKGVDLWNAGGEPIQIIYQICPECASIMTLNQCA